MKKKTNAGRILLIVILLLFGVILFYVSIDIILSNNVLHTRNYTIKSNKIDEPVTVVQLADLHNYSFGYENQELVELVLEQDPDIIVITGDMVLCNKPNIEAAVTLCKKLVEIAPTYYSLGNHEIEQFSRFDDSLLDELNECAVVVLEREWVDVDINGNLIRLGGVSGYPYTRDDISTDNEIFVENFDKTNNFKLLLAHQPEGMVMWGGMEHYDVDLTLSGHTHGGQIKIPFIGAVYAPDQGRFPRYVEGLFQKGGNTIIICRGLGSSAIVPRFNNTTELAVIRLENDA